MSYKLLAFNTTHESLKAEDILISKGIFVNPIPIPRHISADCGLGLRISILELSRCKELLEKENISYQIHESR